MSFSLMKLYMRWLLTKWLVRVELEFSLVHTVSGSSFVTVEILFAVSPSCLSTVTNCLSLYCVHVNQPPVLLNMSTEEDVVLACALGLCTMWITCPEEGHGGPHDFLKKVRITVISP